MQEDIINAGRHAELKTKLLFRCKKKKTNENKNIKKY